MVVVVAEEVLVVVGPGAAAVGMVAAGVGRRTQQSRRRQQQEGGRLTKLRVRPHLDPFVRPGPARAKTVKHPRRIMCLTDWERS